MSTENAVTSDGLLSGGSVENVVLQFSGKVLVKVGEMLGLKNVDPESGLIFVTGGGTGVIGHRVAKRLLDAGYPQVRLGSSNLRHPADLTELNQRGAQVADFSWDQEETYEKALLGVKSVLCTVAYTKDWKEHFPAFLSACVRAGVKHFVKLSFYHARVSGDIFQDVPLVRAHGDCDDILIQAVEARSSDGGPAGTAAAAAAHMSYTILYATHFMSSPFTFQGRALHKEDGDKDNDSDAAKPRGPVKFYGASANRGVNYVSPNDVADVAVRVLLAPRDHYNKEFTLTGPAAITDTQVADLLSQHLERPVAYVDQSLEEFRDGIQAGGDPKWMVEDLVAFERIKASGIEESNKFGTNDVESICNRKAETYEEYLIAKDSMTAMEKTGAAAIAVVPSVL